MSSGPRRRIIPLLLLCLCGGCLAPNPGALAPRRGDEIVVAGQFVHTGTRVVLWLDPGGYDAYRVERRFSPVDKADWDSSRAAETNLTRPNRYEIRKDALTPEELERVRGGGWDLSLLQKVVDQFVIHYDASGTSRQCFKTLQDVRDLSVHFLLDVDGTIYQTLDVKERALHASGVNTRSVGVEIANIGAYPAGGSNSLHEWYGRDVTGRTVLTIPKRFGTGGVRTPGFVGRPARPEILAGKINGEDLVQHDFTPQQYEALAHLTAALCEVLPRIECKCPTNAAGQLITGKLPDDALTNYHGVLGHYHITTSKVDPGPAFDWDYVIGHARQLMNGGFTPAVQAALERKRGS